MIRFRRLHPAAVLPTRGSEESAGLDLTAVSVVLPEGSPVLLAYTGLAVELPRGTYGQIAPRSGLARDFGIQVLGGVIDRDYAGEIVVMLSLAALGPFPDMVCDFLVAPGDRVAQLLVLPCVIAEPAWAEGDAPETGRGDAGFGSTGR